MQYAHRTPHAPDYIPSIRDALEGLGYLEETLDFIEHEDTRRGGMWTGWDMGDLIAYATDVDKRNREIRADMRKSAARHRLCRIIAMQYTRAVLEGYCVECERLAEALDVATREWCNGGGL